MGISENGKCITIERLLELGYEAEDLLHLRIVTNDETLHKEISTYDINRPGLTLTGDYDYFDYEKLQIFGRGEYSYLKKLVDENKLDNVYKFFSYMVTCCIFSHDNKPPALFVELADKADHERGLARIFPASHSEKRRVHSVCSFSRASAFASSSGLLMFRNGSMSVPPTLVLSK